MKSTPSFVLFLYTTAFATACATVRTGGASNARSMDRAEQARCTIAGARVPFAEEDIVGLDGRYDLYLFSDSIGAEAIGTLELAAPAPAGQAGAGADPTAEDDPLVEDDPLAGPPPLLVGGTDVDATVVGAVVPGPATRGEDEAPGVGVYGSPEGDVFVRLGSESNRRDRTRFDGAHTTLRVSSIEPDRFGGSWSSADGADSASGEFCARRIG